MNYKSTTTKELREILGVSYLLTTESAKALHSAEHGTLNGILYLSPWNESGRNVCPFGQHCHKDCLNESGLAKVDILSGSNRIKTARINRTNAFFDNRDAFMELLVREIRALKRKAKAKKMSFACRVNGTSDLSIELFKYQGKALPEYFPGTQFYDYTKVPHRLKQVGKWKNYDITFSYDGYNSDTAVEFLKAGGKVAVVFSDCNHPETFWGYPVVCGDNYDMRYIDPASSVIGLTYHPTAKDYVDGHYVGAPNNPFIVRTEDYAEVE